MSALIGCIFHGVTSAGFHLVGWRLSSSTIQLITSENQISLSCQPINPPDPRLASKMTLTFFRYSSLLYSYIVGEPTSDECISERNFTDLWNTATLWSFSLMLIELNTSQKKRHARSFERNSWAREAPTLPLLLFFILSTIRCNCYCLVEGNTTRNHFASNNKDSAMNTLRNEG